MAAPPSERFSNMFVPIRCLFPFGVCSHRCLLPSCLPPSALPSFYPREVLIKQLEHDLVTAATKLKTQKEETTKKLLAFRQEVRTPPAKSSLAVCCRTKHLLFASLPSSLGVLRWC